MIDLDKEIRLNYFVKLFDPRYLARSFGRKKALKLYGVLNYKNRYPQEELFLWF